MSAMWGSALASGKRPDPPPPPPPPSTVGVVQPQPTPSHPRQQTAAGRLGNAAVRLQQPSIEVDMALQPQPQIAAPPTRNHPPSASAQNEQQNGSSNAPKPQFRTVTFHRTLSQDSGSLSNTSSSLTGHFKDQECLLSPKLQSFFNISQDHSHEQEGGRTPGPKGKGGGKEIANLLFSPSHMDESNEISLLHSIFSPKFHARSAKKKKSGQSRVLHGEESEGNHQYRSIFSPNPHTPGKDIPEDDVSAMSDEFGTINAILRGETAEPGAFTVEEIKKQVGLDPAHHPLSPKAEGATTGAAQEVQGEDGGDGEGRNNSEMHVIFGVNKAYHPMGGISDDTTEVMMEKARLLAGSGTAKGSPSGVKHPVETPRESPTSDDDEFFTPASSAKSSSPPTARSVDVGRMSSGKGLPPVMEDEELKANEGVGGDGHSPEGANNGEFRTPKQDGVGWKMDDFSQSHDEDGEQFFSPLVSHSIHTPSKHKASPVFKNDSIFSLSLSKDELSVTQVEVPSPDVPVAAAATARKQSSSPRYSEAKEQLQSLLKTAKGLSPPEKSQRAAQKVPRVTNAAPQQSVPSFAYRSSVRSTPQSPMSHLHSPSVSSLPRDALTVDFVKQCECVDTLEAILSLLSDDRNSKHRGGKSWGKQLRYPSLVRLVEKRLQKLQKNSSQPPEEEWPVEVRPKMAARKQNPRYQGSAAGDKENLKPIAQKQVSGMSKGLRGGASRPMETITVQTMSNESRGHDKQKAVLPTGSPSSAEGESSLDMDLSQSLFTLDEESYYWKQGMDTGEDAKEDIQPSGAATKNLDQRKGTQTEAARLTGELDSLLKELSEAKSRLRFTTEELSQLKASSTNKEDAWQQQLAELERANTDLRKQVEGLQKQLRRVNQRANDDTRQLQDELEEARDQNADLSQDNDKLRTKLGDLRSIHESAQREVARLKVLIKNNASSDKDAGKMKRVVESAQLANKALAHALAVSEKDLAEANDCKKKSAKDCDALRARSAELEDKTSFLSAKLKEMNKELKSSHVYIDQMYSDLQAQQSILSPSKEMKADFERRELEWVELERRYSQRIQQLENQLVFDSNNRRVSSMGAYVEVIEQTRHYKKEKEQEVAELKASVRHLSETLDRIQRPASSARSSVGVGGKSMKALQRLKQVSPENDENAAPSKPRAQQPLSCRGSEATKQSQGKQLQQGKQFSRVAAVKAHGGRKSLTEQLKRARRFGGKAHNEGA